MASSLNILFRIVYATFYTLLHIILVALLLITPADLINQARSRHNVYPILIVSAVYVGGILFVAFVYFARLYITRSVLNSIPKAWIPIDHGDVRPPVRRMIVAGLSRSAAVAFVSRPRALSSSTMLLMGQGSVEGGGGGVGPAVAAAAADDGGDGGDGGDGAPRRPVSSIISDGGGGGSERKGVRFADAPVAGAASGAEKAMERELGIDLPPCRAVWGKIEHDGWSPPLQLPCGGAACSGGGAGTGADPAMPADVPPLLPYSTVVAELPSLVEATALMLAPRDAMASPLGPPRPDPDAMDLLQRPVHMGLREYLARLVTLGVLDPQDRGAAAAAGDGDHDSGDGPDDGQDDGPDDGQDDGPDDGNDNDARPLGAVVLSFAATYEYARFSTQPLSYADFRQLMHDLATILRRMRPLDPDRVFAYDSADDDSLSASASANASASVRFSDGLDDNDLYGVEDSGREMLSDGHYDGDDDGDNHTARAAAAMVQPRSRTKGALARRRVRVPPSRVRPASPSPSARSGHGRRRNSSSSRDDRSWHTTQMQMPLYGKRRPRLSSSTHTSSGSVRTVQRGASGAASIRSTASGGTTGSNGSSGSVIRLAERGDEARARGLPFVLIPPGEQHD